ncbi:MAG: hypothetical protein ACE5OS_13740 [Anaerolineae bacterium]
MEVALDRLLETGETYYFGAVWDWLTEEQREVLERLARVYRKGTQGGVLSCQAEPVEALSKGWVDCRAVPDLDEGTLQALVDRQVLEREDGRYRFRVELLRRWVACQSLPATKVYAGAASSGQHGVTDVASPTEK